jgi:uncharacterized protein involved in exopolysaccharide biosynthesis
MNTEFPVITAEEDESIDVLDVFTFIGTEKKAIFGTGFVLALVVAVVSFIMPNVYTARTQLMVPAPQPGTLIAAMSGLGNLSALTDLAGIKTTEETQVALLRSEAVQKKLITDLNLKQHYDLTTTADVLKQLKKQVEISNDKKSGMITVSVDDEDPVFAAKLANLHVLALKELLGKLAVSEARQRRTFYEMQLHKAQASLQLAEQNFKQIKEKSGLQVTAALAESSVKTGAEIRGQIAAREVQLAAMSRFATSNNPDVQRMTSELHALRNQLTKLELGSGTESATGSVPHNQAIQAYREVKTQEALLEVIVRQYELARIDESKEGPFIMQIDVASVPEKKSKPHRLINTLAAAFAGLWIGLAYAWLRKTWRNAIETQHQNSRFQALCRAWGVSN